MTAAFPEADGAELSLQIGETMGALRRDRFEFVAAPPATAADVEATAARIGVTPPAAYAQFVQTELNGLAGLARDDFWPAPKPLDVAPFWRFLRGLGLLVVGDHGDEVPAWAGIDRALDALQAMGVDEPLWPLMKLIGDGSTLYCLDVEGRLVLVEDGSTTVLDKTFTQALADEVGELLQRADDWAADPGYH